MWSRQKVKEFTFEIKSTLTYDVGIDNYILVFHSTAKEGNNTFVVKTRFEPKKSGWDGSIQKIYIGIKPNLTANVLYLYTINSLVLPIQVLPPVSLYIPELILHNVSTQQTRHLNLHEHNKRRLFTNPPLKSFHTKRPSYKSSSLFTIC